MQKLIIHFNNSIEITVEKVIEAADSTQLHELILLADKKLQRLQHQMNENETITTKNWSIRIYPVDEGLHYKQINIGNEKTNNAPF